MRGMGVLYGRYLIVQREKLDFAGDLIFILPVDTAFALEVALPFRIRPNNRLSVDTGLEVRGTFGAAKRADIRIPAIVNYNFSARAFIRGETGVQFVNLGKGFNTPPADTQGVAIPIAFRAGGTWKKEDKFLTPERLSQPSKASDTNSGPLSERSATLNSARERAVTAALRAHSEADRQLESGRITGTIPGTGRTGRSADIITPEKSGWTRSSVG